MKKNVKIEKQFEFPTMIGEICAISLEQQLLFVQEDIIRGELIITGKYKSSIASQIDEDFKFSVPVEITILEEIDSSTANIDIVDFYYNMVDNRILSCVIEIQIDAVDVLDENRECDGDPIYEKELEIPVIDGTGKIQNNYINDSIVDRDVDDNNINEVIESSNNAEDKENVDDSSILFNIDLSTESYGTFIVYIVRQNETINSILEKYHTTLDEVEKYNDLKNISMGSKLIIPLIKDEN